MTLHELHLKLVELGINEDRYFLQGLYGSTNDNDKLALTAKREGHSVVFEVYFKERGNKHSERIFLSEDEACQYIFKKFYNIKKIEDKYLK